LLYYLILYTELGMREGGKDKGEIGKIMVLQDVNNSNNAPRRYFKLNCFFFFGFIPNEETHMNTEKTGRPNIRINLQP